MWFCYQCLCLAGPVPAAKDIDTSRFPLFEPGREYHVLTDNPAIGTKSFNLYVPRDYTDDRDWPVIFRYKGRGDKYNPIICRGGRQITCDRGAIIMGMAYVKSPKERMTTPEYIESIRRQLQCTRAARKLVSKHLRIDDDRLFISGSSAGGWLATNLLEYRAQPWAGAMVFVAGVHPSAALLSNEYSAKAFPGLPVFFGSSLPGSSHGANHQWALKGADLYRRRGAIVTFQTYPLHGWIVASPLLRDWVRAYVLDGKTDSIAAKRAKWQQLTRKLPHEIDSTQIIKGQIAKQLRKQPDQLTTTDLLTTRGLSLMGQYVSDLSYLANLPNLQSLDVSFTYVDTVESILHCRSLRTLDISDTDIEDIAPLKDLPELETLRMWNLWLDRPHIDALKAHLPNLKIVDYQWDLYEKDAIGRVLPKQKRKLN
jgi:hypothetical protein